MSKGERADRCEQAERTCAAAGVRIDFRAVSRYHNSMKHFRPLVIAAVFLSPAFTAFASERPIVTDIKAEAGSTKRISVTWTPLENPEPAVTSIAVFRTEEPAASFSEIAFLAPVAELAKDSASFTDSVPDYKDYYYTVVAVTEKGRYDVVIPSVNATVNGVHALLPKKKGAKDTSASAREKLYPAGSVRETPLPYIDLIESVNENKRTAMGRSARAQARLLAGSAEKTRGILSPYVFEEDLISPDGGDDYLLFDVLKTTFIKRKYADAETELLRLLATNRSEAVTSRARFYLGESYYFRGNYADAVNAFLYVTDDYSAPAKKWIDSSLDFMQLPKN